MNKQADERPVAGAEAARPGIYSCETMPTHWVVEAEGVLYIVPALAGGWAKRIRYHGYRESLKPAPGYYLAVLGVPGRE